MLFFRRIVVILSLFLAVAQASLIDDIIKAIAQALTCGSCHSLLVVLQGLALFGDKVFSETFVGVCKLLQVQDDDVCEGTLRQQGPILAHNLRSISALGQTSTKLCSTLLGLCQPPPVNRYTVPIPKPAPTNPKVWTSIGQAPFQVVHFSDVHIDRSYTPGSDADCTKPICCRNYTDKTGPVNVPAGPMGSRRCDTTTSLAQSMLLAVHGQNTKFSIFTGDVIEADIWSLTQDEVASDLQQFNNEMATLLNSPVFPTIGNHEAAPVNSFPRNTTRGKNSQWVFDTQSEGWASMIGSPAATQVRHLSGSYATMVPYTSLRIISLNTVYWYQDNFWLFDSDRFQPDPNGVLAFAVEQLQQAEDGGQRVWIIAHMPPSSGDAMLDQSNYFDQIVQRYKNTIAGQFYGHSHVDEFALAYSDYSSRSADTASSIAWMAPSLTPRDANPSFRVYDVDPDTYEVMDSRTFVSDLADPDFQTFPVWKQEYSARETYGPAIGGWPATQSLNPSFWHRVTDAFVSNDALFQTFNAFKTRGVNVSPCTGACKTNTVCNLRALRAENGCHPITPGLNFRRDGDEDEDEDEEVSIENLRLRASHIDNHCEGVGMRHIFTQMVIKAQERQKLLREASSV
ncbi:unnamed protein product [Cyclocybe aegerita]|uniref:Sphingomyelin phosphodiesterase n=1 Tax=Cyclocybe aegerita TaxID=1973307 RepID=A0A8S0VZA3_CYCAE|nr:unnamed protein product [Cyclocybe aegerita]